MTTYTIHVHKRSNKDYYAVFDSYDGAPIDYETPSQDKIGEGKTEIEAMYNLLEQEYEREE